MVRVHEDIGVVASATDTVDLTGYSTYRVYVTTAFAEDKVVSITGEGTQPGFVNTTSSFHQSAYGGTMPTAIDPVILPLAPDAAYDSWVTIGVDGPIDTFGGEAGPTILQAPQILGPHCLNQVMALWGPVSPCTGCSEAVGL